jgi:hypothetical protein
LIGSRVNGPFQCDIETLLLSPRTLIGQINCFLDEGIDIDRPVLPEPSRECSGIFLRIESARLS